MPGNKNERESQANTPQEGIRSICKRMKNRMGKLKNTTIIIQSFDHIIYERLISNHMFYEQSSRRKANQPSNQASLSINITSTTNVRVKERGKPS